MENIMKRPVYPTDFYENWPTHHTYTHTHTHTHTRARARARARTDKQSCMKLKFEEVTMFLRSLIKKVA